MKKVLIAAPAAEPLTLQEVKDHLRLDSGSFADNVDEAQSIAPSAHATTTGYGLIGSAVDVLSYESLINLVSGTNGATGTVDVKVQHSDDNITYIDWESFTQVTTVNDNTTYEKEYTGGKQYVRAVAQVLLAICDFSVTVSRHITEVTDDTYLTALITLAREYVEGVTWRALITQTWEVYPGCFYDPIDLPLGSLQSVEYFGYTESDGTRVGLSEGVGNDYLVETNGPETGSVVLAYGASYPSFTPYPYHPIQIQFICGYGDTGSDVPQIYKSAMLLLISDWYEHREAQTDMQLYKNKSVDNLLIMRRLYS
jgi:uncharacterized phiE125 gp8 family phage protein